MPLAPVKIGVAKVGKRRQMQGIIVPWRIVDASVIAPNRPIWREFDAGLLRNDFLSASPVYDTLIFFPRKTGSMYYDFPVGITNLVIQVSGNITQLANSDSITVQFYVRGMPNNISSAQEITSPGEFKVVFAPQARREWIIRIRANFN